MGIKPSLARYVTIPRFADLSGISERAIRTKMKDGTWPLGQVYVKAPDGRWLIDVQGYNEWVEGPCYDVLPTPDKQSGGATATKGGERNAGAPMVRSKVSVEEAVLEVLRRKAERMARKRTRGKDQT